MNSETIDHDALSLPALPKGFAWELKLSLDYESPNSVYGIMERASGHHAGVTIKDSHGDTGHWINTNYTPAQLDSDYAKQGRSSPSKEAYKSLQDELYHYLHGDMFTVSLAIVDESGREVVSECMGSDYSEWAYPECSIEDCAIGVAKEYFCPDSMLEQFAGECARLAEKYTLEAKKYVQLAH